MRLQAAAVTGQNEGKLRLDKHCFPVLRHSESGEVFLMNP